jgi:ADP-ribose pyrophosphatase YjhB (NUDIX family)
MLVPGHDYIGLGVGGMVLGHASRAFLARRGPGARNEVGAWEFPGGAVRFGERLEDSVTREFQEEYGMHIETFGLLGVFDHILPVEAQHWVSVTYLCRHAAGFPTILEPDNCTEVGWFSLDTLPSPLSQITIANVEKYNADGTQWDAFREWAGASVRRRPT